MNLIPVNIEVHIKSSSLRKRSEIEELALKFIKKSCHVFVSGEIPFSLSLELSNDVEKMIVCELKSTRVSFWQAEIFLTAFKLLDEDPNKDFLGEETVSSFEIWNLPNKHLHGIWDSIIVNPNIKQQLLGYCDASIKLSEAKVNSDLITGNRMLMLYGEPGTGKTSLCKALAQKVFIRHSSRYTSGVLVEISAHSLFSKFFSESGKLVTAMFDRIHELADDVQCYVFILIDEVESLAGSRESKGGEPGDAVRAVNAALTSLDSLRRRNNTLVMCTSNITQAIDSAFLDRLDISLYLGAPGLFARCVIIQDCLQELIRKQLVLPPSTSSSTSNSLTQNSANNAFPSFSLTPAFSSNSNTFTNNYSLSPLFVSPSNSLLNVKTQNNNFSNNVLSNMLLFSLDLCHSEKCNLVGNLSLLTEEDKEDNENNSEENENAQHESHISSNYCPLCHLIQIGKSSKGSSGRALRKLPLLAISSLSTSFTTSFPLSISKYLFALSQALPSSTIKNKGRMSGLKEKKIIEDKKTAINKTSPEVLISDIKSFSIRCNNNYSNKDKEDVKGKENNFKNIVNEDDMNDDKERPEFV